jgi:hypothetical protein
MALEHWLSNALPLALTQEELIVQVPTTLPPHAFELAHVPPEELPHPANKSAAARPGRSATSPGVGRRRARRGQGSVP